LLPDKAVSQTLSHEELHDFDLTPVGCWCSTDLLAGETNSKSENSGETEPAGLNT